LVANPQLPGIFHALAPLLNRYGYLAVGGFVFLEDFGVPVPGETILIAAAVYAGAGRLNIVAVGIIALVAAVVGDNVGFAIGHFGGRALVLRWGRYVFITEERLDKAEGFFHRHGGKVVTVARFIEGLRQANGIVAGLSKMYWPKFLAFNALGAALWVALWTTVGYTAGSHLNSIYHQLVRYEVYVGIGIVVLIVAFVSRRLWKRHRRRAEPRTVD
jgi:membrane protein DedA with SNARE-associated domain